MSYPATPTTPTTPTAALPRAVQLARTLVFTLVGLLALRTLLSIIWADNLIDAYVGDRQTNSEFVDEAYLESPRDGAPTYTIIAIVSLILFGGLLLLAAVKFADRAGWARIVAIVIGILAALGGLARAGSAGAALVRRARPGDRRCRNHLRRTCSSAPRRAPGSVVRRPDPRCVLHDGCSGDRGAGATGLVASRQGVAMKPSRS